MLQPQNFFSISWSKDSGVGSISNLDGQKVNGKALQGFLFFWFTIVQLPTHVKPLKEVVLIKPYPKFQNTIVKTPKEVGLFKRSE